MLLSIILLYFSLRLEGKQSDVLESAGTATGAFSLLGLGVCWVLFGWFDASYAETGSDFWLHWLEWLKVTAIGLSII